MRSPLAHAHLRIAALALAGVLAATSAYAADPAYVGTWSADLAQCATAQDSEDAPMVIAKDRFDQHETHCTFTAVEGADPEWKLESGCTVEGSAQSADFVFTVSGDTLTIRDEAGTRDLLKCP